MYSRGSAVGPAPAHWRPEEYCGPVDSTARLAQFVFLTHKLSDLVRAIETGDMRELDRWAGLPPTDPSIKAAQRLCNLDSPTRTHLHSANPTVRIHGLFWLAAEQPHLAVLELAMKMGLWNCTALDAWLLAPVSHVTRDKIRTIFVCPDIVRRFCLYSNVTNIVRHWLTTGPKCDLISELLKHIPPNLGCGQNYPPTLSLSHLDPFLNRCPHCGAIVIEYAMVEGAYENRRYIVRELAKHARLGHQLGSHRHWPLFVHMATNPEPEPIVGRELLQSYDSDLLAFLREYPACLKPHALYLLYESHAGNLKLPPPDRAYLLIQYISLIAHHQPLSIQDAISALGRRHVRILLELGLQPFELGYCPNLPQLAVKIPELIPHLNPADLTPELCLEMLKRTSSLEATYSKLFYTDPSVFTRFAPVARYILSKPRLRNKTAAGGQVRRQVARHMASVIALGSISAASPLAMLDPWLFSAIAKLALCVSDKS